MSKTQKTTQLKSKSKLTEDATAKKITTTKTTNVANKATTQRRTTLSTSKIKASDEKAKKSSTSRTSNPGINIVTKAKPEINSDKNQTKLLTTTNNTSSTLQSNIAIPVRKKVIPLNKAPPDKQQPLRAKHSAAIVEAVKKNTIGSLNKKQVQSSKPNSVLDNYHSVTVASPPPRRKSMQNITATNEKRGEQQVESIKNTKLVRKGSRTLEPEEIIVLRRESAKKRIEQQIEAQAETETEIVTKPRQPVKEAVAFDVNFEAESRKNRERSKSRGRTEVAQDTIANEPDNYSDDFESYESDFETGSSSPLDTTTETENETEPSVGSDDIYENVSDAGSNHKQVKAATDDELSEVDEEESEVTQFPITVIQREREQQERKLDSGNYEMNSRKREERTELTTLQSNHPQYDSLDTFSATTSDQLDSGISSYEGNSSKPLAVDKYDEAVCYGGYIDFNTKPIFSKRGIELMSKIQFDTLSYTLFELKPISYDIYMQTYGKLHTTQTSTQTQENRMSIDCQTDQLDMRSMWTQHPPQYDLQTVQRLEAGFNTVATVQNCCGELQETNGGKSKIHDADEFESSLQALSAFRETVNTRSVNQHLKRLRKPVNFEKLNVFLLNASLLMSKVLNTTSKQSQSDLTAAKQLSNVSNGYFKLETRFLNALQVVHIFSNAKYELVISVHESLPEADVYRSDFSNLMMVWSLNDSAKPIRLLSTWSEVCRAEICNDSSNIIVCGLRDGSIAMWDLRETYSFCSKLDGYLTHFAATQSIIPSFSNNEAKLKQLIDLGAVVDVKSFRSPPKTLSLSNAVSSYKSIQFTSLNDTGILTVWTLVETTPKQYELSTSHSNKLRNSPNLGNRFEYSSPWARVKLIQSAICELRDYLERGLLKAQSQFDKTKALFQKDIYNDQALRELNKTQSDLRQGGQGFQGLRFTSLDTGCERIYVCTNRNFILACSKSLKTERFRKIAINDSRFLFPTALRVLTNEDFLAVGLSNGSVIILNCNQQKTLQNSKTLHNKVAQQTPKSHNIPVMKNVEMPDFERDTGKSCAIQNIILNERRSLDNDYNTYISDQYADRPTTAACIDLITNQKKPFELRIYDQQILLSGSVLRKHLVQSLELSSDGWRLFALSNGEVRTYDFYLDRELESETTTTNDMHKIVDLSVARTSPNEQHLLVLNTVNDVVIHLLKQ